MSRLRRLILPDGVHHAGHHVNTGRRLFTSDRDRRRWLRQAAEAAAEHGIVIGHWCLMATHYHLVLLDAQARLSQFMQQLNGGWARCCNVRDDQRGHVLWARFFDAPVQTERHRLEVARYVPLNPVAAGYCERPEQYPWSSHRAILTGGEDPLIDHEWALEPFGGDRRTYAEWVGHDLRGGRFRPPSRLPLRVVEEVRPSLSALVGSEDAKEAARLAAAWNYRLREIAEALDVSVATAGRWSKAVLLDRAPQVRADLAGHDEKK